MQVSRFMLGAAAAATLGMVGTAGAATLYSEDFTGQDDKGVIGTGSSTPPTTDLSGVDWTLDTSNGEYTASSDYFAVVSGVMESQDNDSQGDTMAAIDQWLSPSFSISGYENLSFSFDAGADGDFEADSDDFIVQVIIDGSSTQTLFDATVDEAVTDDPMFFGATQLGALANFTAGIAGTGSTAQVVIGIGNNAGSESQFFDNLEVTGTLIPEPASMALLAAGGLLIAGRQRRRA